MDIEGKNSESKKDHQPTTPKEWVERIQDSSPTLCNGKFYLRVFNEELDSVRTGTSGDYGVIMGYGSGASEFRGGRVKVLFLDTKVGTMTSFLRRNDTNTLVISRPYEAVAGSVLLEEEGKVVFSYGMLSHISKTPDSRSDHANFNFYFTLPEDEARVLKEQIKENPILIEQIFQQTYPGLTENEDFGRVKASKLKIVELSQNKFEYNEAREVLAASNVTEIDFPHSVGELDSDYVV